MIHPEQKTGQAGATDKELITRILAGEKHLYAGIVRRYNQRLYRAGFSILNDDNEVEDAMQAAYISAYIHLGDFKWESAFSTWLSRIMINECLQRVKKRERVKSLNDEAIENQMQKRGNIVATTPFSHTLHSELRTLLENAIRQLPEKYRAVFILRELENMSVAETGECLAISESNVKIRLNRARAQLQEALALHYSKDDILSFHLSRCDLMTTNVMKRIEKL